MQIEFSFPPEARQDVMDILFRLVKNPRRDIQVFERVRKNLIEQLQSKLMSPNFAAMLCAKRRLFGSHVGGNSRLESVEDLEKISLDDLLDFYYSRFDASLVNAASTVAPGVASAVSYPERADSHTGSLCRLGDVPAMLSCAPARIATPYIAQSYIARHPREPPQSCVV